MVEEEETTGIIPVKIVELNTATVDELLTIPGITPLIASKIVNYAINVGFKDIKEIKAIPGVTD
ncbi:MAG: helix-hairpin-helix domain-containing protein, partial [Elusimicrobiota bacterium]|nr:helix-hairpin-helix domain-containing protein [Elusimicrobiota bacterium]